MDKIKEIEKIKKSWEAAIDKHRLSLNHCSDGNLYLKLEGLNAALEILKEPLNTQLKIDGLKCWFSGWCEYEKSLVCHDKCEKYTPTT